MSDEERLEALRIWANTDSSEEEECNCMTDSNVPFIIYVSRSCSIGPICKVVSKHPYTSLEKCLSAAKRLPEYGTKRPMWISKSCHCNKVCYDIDRLRVAWIQNEDIYNRLEELHKRDRSDDDFKEIHAIYDEIGRDNDLENYNIMVRDNN